MAKIAVIVVKNGIVQEVLSQDANISVEVLDLDDQDYESLAAKEQVLKALKEDKSYIDIL